MTLFELCNGTAVLLEQVTSVTPITNFGWGPNKEVGFLIWSGQGKTEVSEYGRVYSKKDVEDERASLLEALAEIKAPVINFIKQ